VSHADQSEDRWVRRMIGYHDNLLARANLRRRRLLDTTNSEDRVMAAPAISGLSMPAAASGKAML
jgi:hypothetical protein